MKISRSSWLPFALLTAALPALAGGFGAMAVSPDGMAVAFGVRSVKLQELATGKMRKEFRTGANTAEIQALAFSPDGRSLYAGDGDGRVTEYPAQGAELDGVRFKGHHGEVYDMAVAPDGTWLATGGEDEFLTIWDVAARNPLRKLDAAGAEVQSVAISPAGDRLAAGDDNGLVMLWDTATWRPLLRFPTGDTVNAVLFTRDGAQLITAGNANAVQFWNVTDGKLARQIPREGEWISSLALSPDGRWLAAGGGQMELRLWELSSGALTRPARHQENITAVAFSNDGSRLVTAGDDNAIHNMAFPVVPR